MNKHIDIPLMIFVIALSVVAVIIIGASTVYRKQSVSIAKSQTDFFNVGRYGKTLILEVNTERTDG